MISPLTSVLDESLFKLELLKLICHNDEGSLLLILGDKERAAAGKQCIEGMQAMSVLMEEYLSILSDPDLEWTPSTITSLDSIKQALNVHFHQIHIECMRRVNKSSLNIEEIIGLNQDSKAAASADRESTLNIKNIKEKCEKVSNAFIQYLTLSSKSFRELSEQFATSKTAETAQDTIDKLLSEYRQKKRAFDELEAVLELERAEREQTRKDMAFNLDKLQNDFDCLSRQYESEEKALNDYESNTTKEQSESHQQMMAHLSSEIEKTTAELVKAKENNGEMELEIKKKVKRMECEIEEIRSRYNADMISISEESDKLQKLNASETDRLHEMQAKIAKLNTIREEHELLLQEQREKEEELKQICERAAIRIQKLWRGHSVRRGNKKKTEKKKKDKKKKN